MHTRWNGEWSERYRWNLLRLARSFFEFARKRGIVLGNPAANIETPDLIESAATVQTPAQVAAVLQAARKLDRSAMRFLAIQYFAGLRTAELMRLTEEHISASFIEVPADKAKTRRRRLVEITPTLRAWLDEGGSLPLVNAWKRLRTVKRKAGVMIPRNAARHSFCSYHLV